MAFLGSGNRFTLFHGSFRWNLSFQILRDPVSVTAIPALKNLTNLI